MRWLYWPLFLLLLLPSLVVAQKENNLWYFGDGIGLDFNTTPPTLLTVSELQSLEGSASIADRTTGALLFYTDGVKVWNRDHNLMRNGTGLYGSTTTTQSAVIVPMPGDTTQYYIFTAHYGPYAAPPYHGINYSVVDMKLDNGRGDVIIKNVPLLASATEKLVAVRDCDTKGYWVIGHGWESDEFYAWPVRDGTGPGTPVISSVGVVHSGVASNSAGYMKASPNGGHLVVVIRGLLESQLFDFDPRTGIVSNPVSLGKGYHYGASFSPDNSKLYINGSDHIYQFDLSNSQPSAILASKVTISDVSGDALQLGPDNKIYIAMNGWLGSIQQPNKRGIACGFQYLTFNWPVKNALLGLPNMIDTRIACEGIISSVDARISSSDTSFCPGSCIDFTDLSSGAPTEWHWTFEGATPFSSEEQHPKNICYPRSGRFRVTLFAATAEASDTTSMFIDVFPAPYVNAGPDRTICPGDSAQLLGIGEGKLFWSPDYKLSCTECQAPFASPDTTTAYVLTVVDYNGCVARDTAIVTVASSLSVRAGINRTICFGDSLQLSASGANNYHWSPSDGLGCTNCPDPVVRPSTTTTYYVTGTSGNCSGRDSITVTVLDAVSAADAGTDTTVCAGTNVYLTASGGSHYTWRPDVSLSCLDCANPIASPNVTTTYHVTITNEAGCSATDSVTVTVRTAPAVDAGEDVILCGNQSAKLSASGGAMYHWSPSDGLSCIDCSNPIASPVATTRYRVDVTNDDGCIASDSVLVTVLPLFTADAGNDQMLCSGETATLTASDGIAWHWSPADGLSCSDCQKTTASPATSTTYHVTITNADGCTADDSVTVAVSPLPYIDAGNNIALCSGQSAQLHITGNGTVRWRPTSGLSCTDCPDPIAAPATTTTYHVILTDANGCTVTDSVTVAVRSTVDEALISISRDHRAFPGQSIAVPITLRSSVDQSRVDQLHLHLGYSPHMLRLDRVSMAGTLLDGWKIDSSRDAVGIQLDCTAPAGAYLNGTGTLAVAHFTAFLGDIPASELPLSVDIGENSCLAIRTEPGLVQLDSVCGLSYRLVASYGKRYALDEATPNPFNPTADIRFSLGLDGPTQLVVFNASGEKVAVLVDDYLQPGTYQATWDATEYPAGLYYYRLTSGAWSATGVMVLKK